MIELKRFIEINNHQVIDLNSNEAVHVVVREEKYAEVHICSDSECSEVHSETVITEITLYDSSAAGRWERIGIITNQWDTEPFESIMIKPIIIKAE